MTDENTVSLDESRISDKRLAELIAHGETRAKNQSEITGLDDVLSCLRELQALRARDGYVLVLPTECVVEKACIERMDAETDCSCNLKVNPDHCVTCWKFDLLCSLKVSPSDTLREPDAALAAAEKGKVPLKLICPRCGVDRYKDWCPNMIDCPLTGHPQSREADRAAHSAKSEPSKSPSKSMSPNG